MRRTPARCSLRNWARVDIFTMREAQEDTSNGGPFGQYLADLAEEGDPASSELSISRNRSAEEQEKEGLEGQRDAKQTLDIDAKDSSMSHCSGWCWPEAFLGNQVSGYNTHSPSVEEQEIGFCPHIFDSIRNKSRRDFTLSSTTAVCQPAASFCK